MSSQDHRVHTILLADISNCRDSKRLALLRSHVSECCAANKAVYVLSVGTDSSRKTSARKSIYRGCVPGKMTVLRFGLSNGDFCFVSSNRPDFLRNQNKKFNKLDKLERTLNTVKQLICESDPEVFEWKETACFLRLVFLLLALKAPLLPIYLVDPLRWRVPLVTSLSSSLKNDR